MMRRTLLLAVLGLAVTAPAAHSAVTVSSGEVAEGGKITFTVASTQPGRVTVTVAEGTAKRGSDYEDKSQTMDFLMPGSQNFEVQTLNDADPEPNEQFTVNATPTLPPGEAAKGTGTIRSEDEPT